MERPNNLILCNNVQKLDDGIATKEIIPFTGCGNRICPPLWGRVGRIYPDKIKN